MNSKKKEFALILPKHVIETSVGALKMCELFVFKVISSPENEISVAVNQRNREVKSNSPQIKQLISMYLASKRLNEFYRQLAELAHTREREDSFSMKILVDGEAIEIVVDELAGLPDIHLQITKSSVA